MRFALHSLSGVALVAATITTSAAALACRNDPNVAEPAASRIQYGAPIALGNGRARTYIVVASNGGQPLEVGVALDSAALEGLPAPMNMPSGNGDGHAHVDTHLYDLQMPTLNPTPYTFVELDWNPQGHEVEGVYTVPHFDFHFYTVTPATRDAIVPTDAQFQQKADNLPAAAYVPPYYSTLTPPNVPTPAVPKMGVHWIDARSPEVQGLLGHPEAARPFTTTFIYGSWNGAFIFVEPMITRAFIMDRRTATTPAQRDSVISLPMAARYNPAGMYPGAYRIAWDAQAKEYRIALTQFTAKN